MGKPIKLDLSVYYSDKSGRIHLFFGGRRATVGGVSGRAKFHPELFKKLGELLREAGKPAPKLESEQPE